MLMASFRPHTFDSFFSDRFASDAARSSAATASTPCAISRASREAAAEQRRRVAHGECVISDSDIGSDTLALRKAQGGLQRRPLDEAETPRPASCPRAVLRSRRAAAVRSGRLGNDRPALPSHSQRSEK